MTLLSGVGWYYTFFSEFFRRCSRFYRAGGTACTFQKYLIGNLTPLMMAFIGGYVYTIVLLSASLDAR